VELGGTFEVAHGPEEDLNSGLALRCPLLELLRHLVVLGLIELVGHESGIEGVHDPLVAAFYCCLELHEGLFGCQHMTEWVDGGGRGLGGGRHFFMVFSCWFAWLDATFSHPGDPGGCVVTPGD